MKKINAVVCTCKKYEDVAILFEKVVETKLNSIIKFTYFTDEPLNISGEQICIQEEMSWSRRISESLKHINSEYVIFMLDDYYILNQINLNKLIEFSQENNPLYVRLVNTPIFNSSENTITSISDTMHYGVNLQLSYWKKDFLLHILNKINGNPWETEISLLRHFDVKNSIVIGAYYYNTGINVLNGVIKGKWNRKIHKSKLFNDIEINQSTIKTMSLTEQIKYESKVFIGNRIKNNKVRIFLKAIGSKMGIVFIKKD